MSDDRTMSRIMPKEFRDSMNRKALRSGERIYESDRSLKIIDRVVFSALTFGAVLVALWIALGL